MVRDRWSARAIFSFRPATIHFTAIANLVLVFMRIEVNTLYFPNRE
jgi:hypothetical protein